MLDLVYLGLMWLFCVVSDMIDYTKLKRAVNLELTLVSNVCAVDRALSHKVRATISIFSFRILVLSDTKMSF